MRIIYDDSKQATAILTVYQFAESLLSSGNTKRFTRQEWGMERVQMDRVKNALNAYISQYGFEIGKEATHAHNIGNNCKYPLYYYMNSDELQICAYINLNTGMYGDGYISLEDYNGEKVGPRYEFHGSRFSIKNF